MGAAVSDVTGLVGAMIGADASKKAAKTQAKSAKDANKLIWDMYQQSRDDSMPWLTTGKDALGKLSDMTKDGSDYMRGFNLSDFQADPGYQFRMDEGQKALERSAAANGNLNSGATLKALSRYGQDYASNEYNNAYNRWNNDHTTTWNRLSSLAGMGQTQSAQLGNWGQQTGALMGNNIIGAGNAIAAGKIGAANSWNGALTNIGNNAMTAQTQILGMLPMIFGMGA